MLIIVAVILLCTYFIIRTFNDIYKREEKIKLIEFIISSVQPSEFKSDSQWYIHFDTKLNSLRRACFYNEGNVNDELRVMIKELTSWLLQRKL
jgi:hypothetical protein